MFSDDCYPIASKKISAAYGMNVINCNDQLIIADDFICVPKYSVSIGSFAGGKVTASETSAEVGKTIMLTIASDTGYELDAIPEILT